MTAVKMGGGGEHQFKSPVSAGNKTVQSEMGEPKQ